MPPPPHPKRPEAVALLRAGKPLAEILAATGLKRAIIYRYAEQEGLRVNPGPRPSRPDRWSDKTEELAELLLGNPEVPAAKIAAVVGVSGQYARQVRASLSDGAEEKQ